MLFDSNPQLLYNPDTIRNDIKHSVDARFFYSIKKIVTKYKNKNINDVKKAIQEIVALEHPVVGKNHISDDYAYEMFTVYSEHFSLYNYLYKKK